MPIAASILGAPRTIGLLIAGSALCAALAMTVSGVLSIRAARRLRQHTVDLYEHPFAVSNAALEARFAASAIRNKILFLVVSREDGLVEQSVEELAALDARLDDRLEIVASAYLGPMSGVREAQQFAAQWQTARDKVVALVRAGDYAGARELILREAGPLHDAVSARLDAVLVFARAKASFLSSNAATDARQIEQHLWWGVTLLALTTSLTGLALGSIVTAKLRERDEAMRLQDAHFRIALEAAPTGMLAVDATGRIDLVNAQVERLFGYSREELLQGGLERLIPGDFREAHIAHREAFTAAPSARAMAPGRDLWALRKDGTRFMVEVGLTPLHTPRGDFTLCSVSDVTERHEATELLQASLREKETLVREVHHRVKNNLQIISSLLGVQASYAVDKRSQALLDASRGRVHSIALVHEMLYHSANLARVKVAQYLQSLVDHIAHAAAGEHSGWRVVVDADDLELSVDHAIPVGLVVNELVTNALKHAFEVGQPGKVLVRLHADDATHLTLEVSDDGRDAPGQADAGNGSGMGLRLVAMLARQLKGELSFQPAAPRGTTARLRFEVQA